MTGELRDPRAALLPAVAAVAGVVLPARLFSSLTAGTDAEEGWAIPAATDIAFAVGILALLGDRIPSGLRLFLLSVAIIDDASRSRSSRSSLVGITASTMLALRLSWGALPEGVSRGHVLGAGALAGIGFTVSLFIAGLAYAEAALVDAAKVGIYRASIAGALLGGVLLLALGSRAPRNARR